MTSRTSGSRRKLWFLAHSWLAMPIWFFLFFVCLTGTIATVSQEIVWLVKPEVRANPPSKDAAMLSPDAIVAAIEREHPEARVLVLLRPPKSMFAWTARAAYPDFRIVEHYVNPYTGALQGTTPQGLSFRSFMRALHGWLLAPGSLGSFGWYAVSLLGLPLLGSLVTGLVVYKRFWRGYLRPQIRFDKGARQFWGYVHRLAGIWSIPFILVISVTGLWFLTQAVLADAGVSLRPVEDEMPLLVAREAVPRTADGMPPPRIGLDRAAEAARAALSELTPSVFALGTGSAYAHIRIAGRVPDYPLLLESAWIDPYSGAVERLRRLSDLSTLQLVTQSMRPLHTGDFAGLPLKLAYFFFGLLLTLMVGSGMLIWSKRTFKETAAAVRQRRAHRRGPAADGGEVAHD
ncbi:MAG: PepSY domain-containing protein [Solimonas sp.]